MTPLRVRSLPRLFSTTIVLARCLTTMAAQPTIPAATIVGTDTYVYNADLTVTDYTFRVPLDYSAANSSAGPQINIFARGVRKTASPAAAADTPYFLWLQGGPGFEVSAPQDNAVTAFLTEKSFQVLYLDQRGTGLSSAVTAETLALVSKDPKAQAEYLTHFRAPQIVQDAEAIRKALIGNEKWGVFGQSFGGFTALTYLSFYPAGLREVFATGGMAPITAPGPDDVYKRLYKQVEARNAVFFKKYPGDAKRIQKIVAHLTKNPQELPSGGTLTVNRFRELGILFGGHGGLDSLHQLITRMNADLNSFGFLATGTLSSFQSLDPGFNPNPMYALVHEPIYCTPRSGPANFSATRTRPAQFNATEPFLFTGEMVYKEAFDTYGSLKPLKKVGEILAAKDDWSELYDVEQLKKNEVPVYAAVYQKDMYVDIGYARETVELVKGAKSWESSVIFHNGIRTRSKEVLDAIWGLRDAIDD